MITETEADGGVDREVAELIYRSCLSLDNRDFVQWLDLCAPEFHYTVTTHSPEVRKRMVWLEHDREGMEGLFEMLPKHKAGNWTEALRSSSPWGSTTTRSAWKATDHF